MLTFTLNREHMRHVVAGIQGYVCGYDEAMFDAILAVAGEDEDSGYYSFEAYTYCLMQERIEREQHA